eukprot:3429437-Rhodomonas_salina.3
MGLSLNWEALALRLAHSGYTDIAHVQYSESCSRWHRLSLGAALTASQPEAGSLSTLNLNLKPQAAAAPVPGPASLADSPAEASG